MKSTKDFSKATAEDSLRRASKLDPIRRSGKDKHQLFKSLSSSDDEDEEEDYQFGKRESILDYMGDEEEEDDDFEEDDLDEQHEDQLR